MGVSDPSSMAGVTTGSRQAPAVITLSDVVAFAVRHWKLPVLGAALFAVVTAAVVLLLVPHRFEAAATLVVVPPKVSSDLKPPTLTVQGYQKLLEADAVVAETHRRLRESGEVTDRVFMVGRDLDSRIFVSRRAEETALAPMLQAIARAESPAEAEAMANTWAAVFLASARDLMTGATSVAVEYIERQFPEVRDRLHRLEEERAAEARALAAANTARAAAWDRRVAAFRGETAEVVAAFQAETRRLMEELEAERNLENRRELVKARRQVFSEVHQEQSRASHLSLTRELELQAAKEQLALLEPKLTLRKAVSDDVVWQTLASRDGGKDWPDRLQDAAMATEVVNPLYVDLGSKVAGMEVESRSLAPRARQLSSILEDTARELQALEASVRQDEVALDALRRGREAGLVVVQETRAAALSALARERDQDMDAAQRETAVRLDQLQRDIEQQNALFNSLAHSFNQAQLARSQGEIEDIRLAAAAVAPSRPLPRGGLAKTLLAALLGAGVGLLAVVARQATGGVPSHHRKDDLNYTEMRTG